MNSQIKKIINNNFLDQIKKVHYSNVVARMCSKFTLEEEKAKFNYYKNWKEIFFWKIKFNRWW